MAIALSAVITLARKHSKASEDDPAIHEEESRFFWVEALHELGIPFLCWDTSDTRNTIPEHTRDQITGQVVSNYPVIVPIDGIPHIVWGSHLNLPIGAMIPPITEHSGVIGIVALEHIDCTR